MSEFDRKYIKPVFGGPTDRQLREEREEEEREEREHLMEIMQQQQMTHSGSVISNKLEEAGKHLDIHERLDHATLGERRASAMSQQRGVEIELKERSNQHTD